VKITMVAIRGFSGRLAVACAALTLATPLLA